MHRYDANCAILGKKNFERDPWRRARALPSSNGTAVPDHEGGKENSLPIAKRSPARREQRTVGIPEAFESPAAYEALMASALAEEMSLRLAHVAAQVRSAAAAGEAGGFSELQARLLPLGVRAFFPCRLEVQRPAFQKRRRRGESSEDEGEKRALASSPPRSQLVLRLPEQRGRAAEYRKDDLWVLSPLWD
ncbi:hypothetical protein H632_c86p3, partial [Helicosporidium sp. ATCC 50920]